MVETLANLRSGFLEKRGRPTLRTVLVEVYVIERVQSFQPWRHQIQVQRSGNGFCGPDSGFLGRDDGEDHACAVARKGREKLFSQRRI